MVTYTSLWPQTVTLTASDSSGSGSITKSNYIYVSPNWTTYNANFSDGFETGMDWLTLTGDNRIQWQITSSAAYSGSYCLYLNSFAPAVYASNYSPPLLIQPQVPQGIVADAITPAISFTFVSSATLSFEYSCATAATNPTSRDETLSLAYSLNCGQTWTVFSTIPSNTLTNAGSYSTAYVPTLPSQWTSESVTLPTAILGKPNVRFRLEYSEGFASNNIYIDNVNLSGVLSVDNLSQDDYYMTVFPNPASTTATVTYVLQKQQHISIKVTNVLGQNVASIEDASGSPGQNTSIIDTEDFAPGIYFVQIMADNNQVSVKKLVISK